VVLDVPRSSGSRREVLDCMRPLTSLISMVTWNAEVGVIDDDDGNLKKRCEDNRWRDTLQLLLSIHRLSTALCPISAQACVVKHLCERQQP
jgi:hypothetical protein